MKRLISLLSIAIMLFSSACALSACSQGGPTPESQQLESQMESGSNDLENPAYANEEEGADVQEVASDDSTFIGKWEAPSDRAEYLYGNINLTISKDGTWSGNLTGEDFSGKWKYNGSCITISSELVNADLFKAKDGTIMFRDHDTPEDLIVLMPVK